MSAPENSPLVIVAAEGPGYRHGGVGRHVCEILPRLASRRPTTLLCIPSYCLSQPPDRACVNVGDGTVTLLDPDYVSSLRNQPFDVEQHGIIAGHLATIAASHLPTGIGALLLEDHFCAAVALQLADMLAVRRLVVFAHLPLSARFSYFDKGADEERQQLLESAALLCADAVLVPSSAARRTLSHVYPIAPARIEVMPLGAVGNDALPSDIGSRHARIATVARFTEQKGWKAWIDIVAAVEARGDAPIWALVGDGPLRATVLERLRAIVPEERIEWVGQLEPEAALPSLLRNSAIFLLPSAHETFGLAALEAAAHGAVPVLTNLASTAEVWGDRAILVSPGDVATAAEQIHTLLNDPETQAKASATAWRHAQSFGWDTHVDRLAAVLRSG